MTVSVPQYWLMKSEPSAYAWTQLLKDRRTPWNGVRNYQANNNMKLMRRGDQAFFYHSNEDRAIVGIMEVIKEWYLDPADPTQRFGMVDVAPVASMPTPVTLAFIKKDPALAHMILLKQSRLSVTAVDPKEWKQIVKVGKAGP
jgi:predicted RNA-binding protein with PUA-like domain